MSVLYDDVQMDSQEYKGFEIYAVTINISMTEYHHWINSQAYHLFSLTQQSMERMSKINLVTCLFSLLWNT